MLFSDLILRRREAPSRRMEHGTASPVAVLRDARGACQSGRPKAGPVGGLLRTRPIWFELRIRWT